MRIAIDCRAFEHLSRYLGIGTYTSNLVQALARASGHHQFIPFARAIKQEGNEVDSSSEHQVERRGFRIAGKHSLLNQLTRHRVDLCHILEFTPPFAPAHRAVVTVHDLIPLIFPNIYLPWYGVRTRWNFRAYYRFLREARQIVAVSQHTKADLIRFLNIPQDRIRVIYSGVNPAFRPLSHSWEIEPVLREYKIPIPYVLYVGSCDYRKNIPGLMRAFAQFRVGEFEEFHLVLVGKGTELNRESLREYGAGLGLTHHLHLAGYVPLKQLVALYNGATLLVYPSFYEGFGFPPLEAMACGVPAVTSKNSALSEVTGGSALLVDPYDEGELREAMRRVVLDHGLRKSLIQKGLAHVWRFSWDRTAQETLRVYDEIGGPVRFQRTRN